MNYKYVALEDGEIVARFASQSDRDMFQRISRSGCAVRNFNPEKEIVILWSVEDVRSEDVRPDLTDEQAMEVLRNVERNHNADIGVSWSTLRDEAEALFPKSGFDCGGNCAVCKDTSNCDPEMVKNRLGQDGGLV